MIKAGPDVKIILYALKISNKVKFSTMEFTTIYLRITYSTWPALTSDLQPSIHFCSLLVGSKPRGPHCMRLHQRNLLKKYGVTSHHLHSSTVNYHDRMTSIASKRMNIVGLSVALYLQEIFNHLASSNMTQSICNHLLLTSVSNNALLPPCSQDYFLPNMQSMHP